MPTPPFVAGNVLTAAQLNLGAYQVGTATIAGTATTLQVNNVFSADWRHYRIYISGSSATAGNLVLQLSSGGTAANTSYYWNMVQRDYGASPTNPVTSSGGSGASVLIGLLNTGASLATSSIVLDVTDPYAVYPTGFFAQNNYNATTARSIMGTHYTGASYDGFKLTGVANLTLNISIYGFIGG